MNKAMRTKASDIFFNVKINVFTNKHWLNNEMLFKTPESCLKNLVNLY